MTQTTIAFASRLPHDAAQGWLDTLRAALPDEVIRPAHDIPPQERAGVDIAIVANPDPADLTGLPNLKLIHSLWAGVERLVSDLSGSDVPIVRLVDPELGRTMAESVLAWTLYLTRDMPAYRAQQAERIWAPLPYRHPRDVTVGILGLGNLGRAAATTLRAAGFDVTGWSRTFKHIPDVRCYSGDRAMGEMLAQTDILVCLLPLTPDTRGMLSHNRLALLPRGASFINFGRGPIVDRQALLAALDDRQIGHAVLDVFDREPLPADDPFWGHPHVTVLPHASAPTDRQTATQVVADNLAAFRRDGTLPETVDIARGY